MNDNTFVAPKGLSSKYRSLKLVIINCTREKLAYDDEYFNTGSFYDQPKSTVITSGRAARAFVANKAGLASGVTGGMRYVIEKKGKYLVMGFTNPIAGCFKNFVQCTSDENVTAETGYDNAEDGSIKRKVENGYIVQALIHPSTNGADKLMEYFIEPDEPEED